MSRICFISNSAWNFVNFRLPLAEKLIQQGHEVYFISPADGHEKTLQEKGYRWVHWGLKQYSTNPFTEVLSILRLIRILKSLNPKLTHAYTLKAVLYSSVSTLFTKTPIVFHTLTGFGHLFVSERKAVIKNFIIQTIRVLLNRKNTFLIFQNSDDYTLAIQERWANAERSSLVPGSGVDADYFSPLKKIHSDAFTVTFASRLLIDKGICEFIDAAIEVNTRVPKIKFLVAGGVYEKHPSSIPKDYLKQLTTNPIFNLVGETKNIVGVLAKSDVVVLPSYREGLPRILLEASSMQIPIITTDVPGCRELIQDELTGLRVPHKNSHALARAIERYYKDESLRNRCAEKARENVLAHYTNDRIIHQIIELYKTSGLT